MADQLCEKCEKCEDCSMYSDGLDEGRRYGSIPGSDNDTEVGNQEEKDLL